MCNILAGDDPLANGDRCHGVLEGSPLLPPAKETVISLDYGTYTPTSPAKKDVSLKDIKDANDDDDYDDEDAMDWWSKYFASVDLMIKEGVANRAESIVEQPIVTTHTKKTAQVMIPSRKTGMNPLKSTVLKWGTKLSPKVVTLSLSSSCSSTQVQRSTRKGNKVALLKVYPNELEAQARLLSPGS